MIKKDEGIFLKRCKYNLRGTQRLSGFPTKCCKQTHWLVSGSHFAPRPQLRS